MTPYKISTILLSMALVGLVIYHYSTKKDKQEFHFGNKEIQLEMTQEWIDEVYDFLSNSTISEEIQESWVDLNYITFDSVSTSFKGKGIHRKNTGGFINQTQATSKLSSFTQLNTRANNSKWIEPYAFAFGLDNIKSFIDNIETVNRSIPDSLNQIAGVRAYLIVSKDSVSHYDLLMTPARRDGNDYIQIAKRSPIHSDTLFFLNTSAPCPNNCDPPL